MSKAISTRRRLPFPLAPMPRIVMMTALGPKGMGNRFDWRIGRGSTFLPEVASEQGWSKEDTFKHLAMKAGLRPDDWKGGDFSLYTTQIISEESVLNP